MTVARSKIIALALLIVLAGVSAAQAQTNYIAFHGGYVQTNDPDLSVAGGDIPHTQEPGYAAGIALGHDTSYGVRMELEGTYRSNPIDSLGGAAASGDLATASIMGNLIFDIDRAREVSPVSRTRLIPYLGLGVGGAYIEYKDVQVGGVLWGDDANWAPAAQGIVGIGIPLGGGSVISIDYRYFRTFVGDFQSAAGVDFKAEYTLHTAMLSLRAPF